MLRPVAVAAALAVAGCGSAERPAAPVTPNVAGAAPYRAKNPLAGGRTAPLTASAFRRPIARYRRHVRTELAVMLRDVRVLRAATARGDLTAARSAWLRAAARYETIGAAYGAFGEADRAINGTPAGLPGGERSARFTGLHRVELALWKRHSTSDAARPAARLARDVARLRTRVGSMTIAPLDYSLRAHEILEDTLHLHLSGQASPWSSNALTALDANLDGTRAVLRTLAPLIDQRDPSVLPPAERALTRVERKLHAVGRAGRLPRWDAVSQRDREAIAGLTAAAAERLAYVPEVIDPRGPRAAQSPIEVTTR